MLQVQLPMKLGDQNLGWRRHRCWLHPPRYVALLRSLVISLELLCTTRAYPQMQHKRVGGQVSDRWLRNQRLQERWAPHLRQRLALSLFQRILQLKVDKIVVGACTIRVVLKVVQPRQDAYVVQRIAQHLRGDVGTVDDADIVRAPSDHADQCGRRHMHAAVAIAPEVAPPSLIRTVEEAYDVPAGLQPSEIIRAIPNQWPVFPDCQEQSVGLVP